MSETGLSGLPATGLPATGLSGLPRLTPPLCGRTASMRLTRCFLTLAQRHERTVLRVLIVLEEELMMRCCQLLATQLKQNIPQQTMVQISPQH